MRRILVAAFVVVLASGAFAGQADLVTTLIQRVRDLREGLSPEQADKLNHEFDEKGRVEWTFLPGDHAGLPMSACSDAQQQAMLAVVKVALSASGFAKTELVRELDEYIHKTEGGAKFGSGQYFLSVWGEPGEKGPWSLRWEGHHISLNWLIRDGHVMSSTPQFIGARPATVPEGPLKGTRAQPKEEDMGRALLASLDDKQREQAVIAAAAPEDVLTKMLSQVERLEDSGIPYASLTPGQQAALRDLIQLYIEEQAGPIAEERAKVLKPESLASVKFVWMGGSQPGEPHYYRIQGNGWVIEYVNFQDHANHIHTVWRDIANDFGRDVLREHLAMEHSDVLGLPF